ncbi:photosystem I chlorophyll a/b-binding protein 6, chloroplastic-like [Impatiens glandulifera]|uniref:photosystem I chlorophyll a/b-binding protein 6, chloroplastic-like n=1 Tax=Impatiens glandulifera TaxID=253017 RepID=UPI001FB10314|nr:photosystem I chlorophyll a/b-binding protein 6, chloroplastic-like [Impatiens glandulifera]
MAPLFCLYPYAAGVRIERNNGGDDCIGGKVETFQGETAGNTQKVIEKDVTFFFCKDSPPPWFDGSISGDFGFDPLGLGKRAFFAQAELIHSRWAMLAVSGILIPEWLESLGFIEKFSWYDAGAQEYFADSTPLYIF